MACAVGQENIGPGILWLSRSGLSADIWVLDAWPVWWLAQDPVERSMSTGRGEPLTNTTATAVI